MIEECGAGDVEFSRPIDIGGLEKRAKTVEITADAGELAALARRFNLVAIAALTATVTLETDEEDQLIHLRGTFAARVTQSCVVTLEPVAAPVEGVLEGAFTTDMDAAGAVSEMAPDTDVEPGEDDLPEILEGDEIDIGEVVAEHLGLHLDPYPRRPGVLFSPKDDEDAADESPFAVLGDLKTS